MPIEHDRVMRGARVLAGQRGQQLLLAIAGYAGDAEDLAGMHFEEMSCKSVANGWLFGSDSRRTASAARRRLRGAACSLRQFGADHHARQARRRSPAPDRSRRSPGRRASRCSLAQRPDLVELVADVEDAAAFGAPAGAACRTAFRTACGVSTEVGSSRISSCGLVSSARTISTRCRSPTDSVCTCRCGSSVQPVLAAHSAMRCVSASQLRRPAAGRAQMFSATVRVSNSEKCWNTIAMPSCARRGRAGDLDLAAIPEHLAGIGLDRAVDDLHQRRLAGAVFTQHGMDLAGLNRQVDAVVGYDGRILLGDAAKRQSGSHVSSLNPGSVLLCLVLPGSNSTLQTGRDSHQICNTSKPEPGHLRRF